MNKREIYFKDIPSFISKIVDHLGYQIHIMQIKEMYSGTLEVYSQEEEKIKDYIDTYFYLLNNTSNCISERIINKSFYILTNKKVNKEKVLNILKEYHSIKEKLNLAKIIKYSYLISLLVRNKKDQYIYFLMMINYFLAYNHYKLIKIMPNEFEEYDKVKKEYEKGNLKPLEDFIIYKETISKVIPENYYQNLKEVDLLDVFAFIIENKEELKTKYRINHLSIYGSFVRGKQRIDSDIDLIVKFKEYTSLLETFKYKKEIEKMMFNKFHRFCDVHIEREKIDYNKINIFKDNIKVI